MKKEGLKELREFVAIIVEQDLGDVRSGAYGDEELAKEYEKKIKRARGARSAGVLASILREHSWEEEEIVELFAKHIG